MRKFLLAVMALCSITSFAQYEGNKFFDNWSIGTGGGISTNLHDWDVPTGGIWDVSLYKGVNPVLSIGAEAELGFNNNANWNVYQSQTGVDNASGVLMAKVNLMNLFSGYQGKPRVFEISPKVGAGYMRYFWGNTTDHGNGRYLENERVNRNAAITKFGIDFDFNLGKESAWTLSLKPAVVLDVTHGAMTDGYYMWGCDRVIYDDLHMPTNQGCPKYSHAATARLTAGVTYHFKSSNGKHHFTPVKPEVITKTVEKIVEKKVPVEKIVETTKIVEKPIQSTYVVMFPFNSAELDQMAKQTLDKINGNACIKAYASPEGNFNYNKTLSQKRANAVMNYLKKRGVNVIEAIGAGASSKSSNRIAIITVR